LSLKPKILADENIPRTAIQFLRNSGYDIVSVWEMNPGMSDEQVVELSIREQRIIITFDKDFGRIALTNPNVPGVMLLRFSPISPEYIARRIISTLETVGNPYGKLVVVRRKTVRIIPLR
jgi:predicted nuclease of predicted toxin-antitoxin system